MSRNLSRRGGSGAVLEAPAFVAGFNDVAVMGEAIEQRRRHFGVVEDIGSFAEGHGYYDWVFVSN